MFFHHTILIIAAMVAAEQREKEAERDDWHGQVFKRLIPLKDTE